MSPRISVVIPTRDRAASLRQCLEAALDQVEESDQVIVVDDGSKDETKDLKPGYPSVTWLDSEGRGTCAARNLGVHRSSGDVVMFIDDDVVCAPGLIDLHREFHRVHQDSLDALGGLVTWDPSRPITKHMLWLEDGGPLFSFNTITDPNHVDPSHFCTANVSVKRELLSRVDGPFDERIKRFTDVELGHRLANEGMRLHYDRNAVGWHLRKDNPASTDQRMFAVGQASVVLDRLHPGIAPIAASRTPGRRFRAWLARGLSPLAPLLPESVAGRIWASRAAWAYASGRESEQAKR